jgi:hypothetical protein
MDLSKLYEGQKAHDKSGLGYKKNSSSLSSNNHQNPKRKGKQNQSYNDKNVYYQNVRNASNYAFRYRSNNGRYVKNKSSQRYNNFNPSWSSNIYHKESDGWCYEVKNRNPM